MASPRKILLLASPYLVVLLLLVLAELALRAWDHVLDNPLTNEVTYDGIEWYQINRGYLKKYFPANTPLIPEFKTSVFRRRKLPNTFRVFCLGESSMFGTPYQMTCNIPGIVRKQLRALYPEEDIEAVNWGASAINTNVIADLAGDLVRYQPDLVLLYAGHNEFYGPDGVGASFIEKHFPFTIPLKYRLRDLRLAAVLYNLLFSKKGSAVPSRLNLMEEVSRGNTVHLNSESAERVFRLFTLNLKSIVETFKASGVPVIMSDVASNITFPPFISDSLPGAQHMVFAAESVYAAGRYMELRDILLRHEAVDSTNAAVNFWLGKAEMALGRFAEAKHHLISARDNDLLKFRAPSRINLIIRQVAVQGGIPFVSTDSLFSSLSKTGIAGDDLFWEHLHPTALGYYSIASLFTKEILRSGQLNGQVTKSSPPHLLPFDPDSLSICWLDLAYGDLSVQHLTGRWPFVGYHRTPTVLGSADTTMRHIALDVYQRKIEWEEACYRLAAYFWRQGRMTDAKTTYEALLEEYPFGYYTHYLLGSLLHQENDLASSLQHYRRSIELNPHFLNARLDMGLIQINTGDFDGAVRNLSAARDATTDQTSLQVKANIHYGLAAVYANTGDLKRALEEVDASLKLQPRYRDALALREKIAQQDR